MRLMIKFILLLAVASCYQRMQGGPAAGAGNVASLANAQLLVQLPAGTPDRYYLTLISDTCMELQAGVVVTVNDQPAQLVSRGGWHGNSCDHPTFAMTQPASESQTRVAVRDASGSIDATFVHLFEGCGAQIIRCQGVAGCRMVSDTKSQGACLPTQSSDD